jgi:hypothetical protein
MKYTKRLTLNRVNPTKNSFAYEIDGTIVTDSKTAMQLPSGATSNRPANPVNGEIRYNQSLSDSELYNISGTGAGWEKIKTNRQSPITPQNLGAGNYSNTLFGPLAYNVSITSPQNVLVFVDNVYQIPTTNYTLVTGSSVPSTASLLDPANNGSNTLSVSTTTNILPGMIVTGPTGIQNGTTVTSVSSFSINIYPPINAFMPVNSNLTFSEGSKVYVNFTSAVPNKPVFVLLGFDGYSPPNS